MVIILLNLSMILCSIKLNYIYPPRNNFFLEKPKQSKVKKNLGDLVKGCLVMSLNFSNIFDFDSSVKND